MSKQLSSAAHGAAALFSFLKSHSGFQGAIVADDKTARFCADACKLLELEPFVLPDLKAQFGDDLRSYQDELIELAENLSAFYRSKNKKRFLVIPAATATKYLPAANLYETFALSFGDDVDTTTLKDKLIGWGYNPVDVVEQKGEFSVRGEVIDLFGVGSEQAVRLLLDGAQIESIRYFDPATQKTAPGELDNVTVQPALFSLDSSTNSKMKHLIDEGESDAFFKDIGSLGLWQLEALGLGVNLTEAYKLCLAGDLADVFEDLYLHPEGLVPQTSFDALPVVPAQGAWLALAVTTPKTLIDFHHEKKVTIALAHESQMRQHNLDLNAGHKLLYTDAALNLIGPDELILSLNKPAARKKRRRQPTLLLDELSVGDYIVHENYGVGRFEGLEQVSLLGGKRDFVSIRYAGEDKLLLPVENLHLIDRFVGESGMVPAIDRLGKGSFAKLKEGVKNKLYEIASEIIRRAAEREVVEAAVIEPDATQLEQFQNDAGFDYTPDQARSIDEIFSDLKSGKVMDRLLSGDVGFGKTEVAMNAIFAAVQAGYQAALIVPTTLLSNQHYLSLKSRLGPYGIDVRRIDRFTPPNEKRAAQEGLANGKVPVVVGTHALLGVQFKNLALMVVDEEHKFGVKQKEALKDKAAHLHLLTMSATPIPRSLNMALSQIKGFSQIMTPPLEREDVRTLVKEADDKTLKEAILRELRRGGQVFYVFNRIAGIEQKKKMLKALLPNLRILVLHSQVAADVSEKELINFQNGDYDLLLSTTIIESGIHMPNVNTIIIDGADRFGMADLHQLRGRVGRARRQGYCYFMVEEKESLTEEAKKRLIALENNSYLGSGSALAFHDLEIRGGGNILGADQSGHIKHIGYGLYLKMLEDALSDLSGKEQARHEKPVDLRLAVKAYIAEETVAEERLRLELYRRFAQAKTVQSVYELEEEMADRFGKLDSFTRAFIDLMAIKVLATQQDIQVVQSYQQSVTFTLEGGKKETLNAPSKDDDDVIKTALEWLKKRAG